ncbi:BglG family transcription antiterminator [Jeotgalibacillus sp. ET6]|uniref:BglG family transcription antiterminator n=1 Tax=Jeotgalibacillus sp. ET6 TaxID=3037260 RepID=UPI0024185341|nr:BglG family transcription antiterminator [Jeotgalibacillus sp. ET6]MDG5472869.1 BglG family transcription antiterminator [Jeotgalibacillus sp. ET6]
MVYVTGRERKIIESLLRTQHQFTTIRELADAMDVSSRTIHRELKKIERMLAKYSIDIEKLAGEGIRLSGDGDKILQLEAGIREGSDHDLQQDERIVLLLHYLIRHREPVKAAVATRALNCALGTLMQDLDLLEEAIKPYGLSIIRKRGFGIQLAGSERERRRALATLLIEQIDTASLYSMVDEHFVIPGGLDEKIANIVSKDLVTQIERLIMDEVKELPYTIADSAYMALVIHIALAMDRIQSGEQIELEENVIQELRESPELKVAESLARSLSAEFNVVIPIDEIGYMAIQLKGANRKEQLSVTTLEQSEWTLIVQSIIQKVGKQVGVNLTDDHSLFEGLIAHLEPAIHRAEEGLQAFNPLQQTIKDDYPILYHSLEQVLKEVFPQLEFSMGELAFLVLHFASTLEMRKEAVSISALVVCSSGIGTSKMLASRLKKEFPEITDITLSSLQDARMLTLDQFDMVISTVGLMDLDREFLLVSPLLPENEVEKVKRYLQKNMPFITNKKGYRTTEVNLLSDVPVLDSLKKINHLTSVMMDLLTDFDVIEAEDGKTEEDLLKMVDAYCAGIQAVSRENIVKELLEAREHLGGLGIPDTGLALYHARSQKIERPLFVLFDLKTPVSIKAMDSSSINMERLLLLIAPDGLDQDVYELLSLISASIIEEDHQLALFTNGSKGDIYRLLERKFDQFIRKKMNLFLEGST